VLVLAVGREGERGREGGGDYNDTSNHMPMEMAILLTISMVMWNHEIV
jgi:hypothetical protein